jgi:hypothetical protein
MDARGLSIAAVACAALVVLGVFLPWVSLDPEAQRGLDAAREMMRGMGELARSVGASDAEVGRLQRELDGAVAATRFDGTTKGFNGTVVLILGILGGAAAAATLLRSGTVPLTTRALLLAALGLFGLGFVLTLADLFQRWEGAGRGVGIWLTALATGAGAAAALLALRRTPVGQAPPAAASA